MSDSPRVTLDVQEDFPGGRIRKGDQFVLHLNHSAWPVAEIRWQREDFLSEVERHLSRLTCRVSVCSECPFQGGCPLPPAVAYRRGEIRLVTSDA